MSLVMQVELCGTPTSTATDSPAMAASSSPPGSAGAAVELNVRVDLEEDSVPAASTVDAVAEPGTDSVSISGSTLPAVGLGLPIASAVAMALFATAVL